MRMSRIDSFPRKATTMEDDKKRKRGRNNHDNRQDIEDITHFLPKRPRLKHKVYLKGLQESLSTKNEITESIRQFSLIKPSSTTRTIVYWPTHYHHFYCATPDYFSSINQQLVPAMIAPTTKQCIFPINLPIQPFKPQHTINHSSSLFGQQPCAYLNNVSTRTDITDLTVEPIISINSNDKYDQIYDSLKACIDSNTTNSTITKCATPTTQDFAAFTYLNEVQSPQPVQEPQSVSSSPPPSVYFELLSIPDAGDWRSSTELHVMLSFLRFFFYWILPINSPCCPGSGGIQFAQCRNKVAKVSA
ncbi:hypothetical protein SAY87_009575 [Trapa incisa]|uniref:Uncharacterized protein n=1 Tax=Trapa incisa TaxID=236973 RepID=A0AAN7JVW0_9MYRT|nr:hypothetical protein SAY87_009575 [Trapa incisa]